MRINFNFQYDKLHLKEITILIPKYHANMVSFLTPILGLYGINVKEFINDFDIKTKFISFDVVIPVTVKISKIKTFEIALKTPYVTSLLSNLPGFSLNKPNLDLLSIYKISLVKSLFNMHLTHTFHKRTYLALRKYLSLIIRVNFQLTVVKPVINFTAHNYNRLRFLKNSTHLCFGVKNLIKNKFGFFVLFNNSSASLVNYLRLALETQNISVAKIKPKLLTSLVGQKYFYGNAFYISSANLNSCFSLFKDVSLKNFYSNFFPCYFRIQNNLIHQSFLKLFLNSFNFIAKDPRFYLLKIIHSFCLKSLKTFGFLNKKLLFILKYNANISPNIS
jgi:hypothetical protein